jgi:drug/metabolite transporter (DMT)-like permease
VRTFMRNKFGNRELLGTLLALFTAVISGIAIPLNKIFVVDMDPAVFTAVRAVLIGLVFLLISLFTHGFSKSAFRRDWKYLAVIAVVGGALAFLLFFTGLKFTTAGRAAFIHKTLPVYVAALALVFLKEKISRKQFYAFALMLIGLAVIFAAQISPGDLWADPQLGDALVLGATVLWAVENVVARKVMREGGTNFVVSFARMFFGGLVLFGAVVLAGKAGVLLSLTVQQWNNVFVSTVVLFGYVLFWYWSIRHINVSKASALLLLSPVVSLAAGAAWLGEPTPPVQLFGSALILIGAYYVAGIKSELQTGV